MNAPAPRGLLREFSKIEDPRMNRTKRHNLQDILAIAICAVICGADGWVQIETFGKCKLEWFKTFLALPHGIPSHDTFGRVFAMLKPQAFEQCFMNWVAALRKVSKGQLVAIDGKTVRRSFDTASDKAAIHMVSAWCKKNQMVIGQITTAEKSNEIKAIPQLLKILELDNAIITIDAMGCQKKIAKAIVENNADYILQLKGNQQKFHDEVVELFENCLTDDCHGIKYHSAQTADKGHGRIEVRKIVATNEIEWFAEREKWKKLRSLVRVESQRTVDGKTSNEFRYYISSLPADDPAELLDNIRSHWGVENSLHWSLDIGFREDECRIRQGHAAENFSRLNRIALNLLKAEKTLKGGIKTKRLACGWDHNYLLKILTQEI